MLNLVKKIIALDNPARLFYHYLRAVVANLINGNPGSKNIKIIGVTGTNGKTTTTNIIAKSLQDAGKKVFMYSTVNYILDGKEEVNHSKMTSPDVFVIQNLLRQAVNAGAEYAVIETSSHSILMHRNYGIQYDVAVLTNISQDHLDLHRTMKNYIETKLRLFKDLIGNVRKKGVKKTAIINGDIKEAELFLEETYDKEYTYGLNDGCGLRATNVKYLFDKTTFEVKIPGDTLHIETPLRGKFNVYNILAAISVLLDDTVNPRMIEKSIKNVLGVPGRMEEIPNNIGAKIYVDYAHTEDALEQVLQTVGDIEGIKRVITVFGATGDRDKTKRPGMGEIVSEYSNLVILTQDDDYSEDTIEIIKDVMPGINRKQGDDFYVIPDRKDAIRQALLIAKKGDVVLLAGKGAEQSMITNEGVIEWSDKDVVLEILKDLDDNKIIN